MSSSVTVSSESALHQLRTIEKLRRVDRAIALYHAGDEPYVFKCDGETFVIPPDGPWKGPDDREVRGYDGTLLVNDIYGIPKSEILQARKEKRLRDRDLQPTQLRLSAIQIVSHAVQNSGGRVVALIGTESEQAQLRQLAREACQVHKKDTAEAALAAFRRRNDMLVKNGREPELMSEYLSKMQVWLDDYRSGAFATQKFICPVENCGFQHNDESLMQRHIAVSHSRAGKKKRTADLIDTGEETETPARGRRRKAETEN